MASYSYDLNEANGDVVALDDGETLTETYTYTITDGTTTATADLVITINGVNDGPVANDDEHDVTALAGGPSMATS